MQKFLNFTFRMDGIYPLFFFSLLGSKAKGKEKALFCVYSCDLKGPRSRRSSGVVVAAAGGKRGGKQESVWFCGTQKPNGEILETAILFCRHQLFTWKSFFMPLPNLVVFYQRPGELRPSDQKPNRGVTSLTKVQSDSTINLPKQKQCRWKHLLSKASESIASHPTKVFHGSKIGNSDRVCLNWRRWLGASL